MEEYIIHVAQLSNIPDYSTSLLTTVQDYCLTDGLVTFIIEGVQETNPVVLANPEGTAS